MAAKALDSPDNVVTAVSFFMCVFTLRVMSYAVTCFHIKMFRIKWSKLDQVTHFKDVVGARKLGLEF